MCGRGLTAYQAPLEVELLDIESPATFLDIMDVAEGMSLRHSGTST